MYSWCASIWIGNISSKFSDLTWLRLFFSVCVFWLKLIVQLQVYLNLWILLRFDHMYYFDIMASIVFVFSVFEELLFSFSVYFFFCHRPSLQNLFCDWFPLQFLLVPQNRSWSSQRYLEPMRDSKENLTMDSIKVSLKDSMKKSIKDSKRIQ